MENERNQEAISQKRLICFYCGTIYDEERGRCPLCGSTATAGVAEDRPTRRQTAPVEEKKERGRGGKYAAGRGKTPKGLLIGAIILLALAVAAVTYFIGDMIGLWPGLEDSVVRDYQTSGALEAVKCSQLIVEPESLSFSAPGETQILTVRVNADCEEVVYCNSSDANVATISLQAETSEGAQMKTATFTITSTGGGDTELNFTCGEKSAVCAVHCEVPPTTEYIATEEPFFPELNLNSTVVLTDENAQAILRVTNLTEDRTVAWSSSNEEVATVDADGYVTAVGEGDAIITADVGGWTASILFRADFSRDAVDLNEVEFDLDVDRYFVLKLRDEDGDEIEDVVYQVEDPEICEYDDGRIYGLKEGVTQITVSYRGETYVCVVYVS